LRRQDAAVEKLTGWAAREAEIARAGDRKACHIRQLERFTLGIDEPRGYGAAPRKKRIQKHDR
jgi:hypothetical protein